MDFSMFSDVFHGTRRTAKDTAFTDVTLCRQFGEPCSSLFFSILNFNLQFPNLRAFYGGHV
jgi:hypothetical protein